MARNNTPAAATADAVQAPEPPDAYLKRHMVEMELWTYETLQRAIAAGLGVQLSVLSVTVETDSDGCIFQTHNDRTDEPSPLCFAAQAGLLLGAGRALQAAYDSASG